MWPAFSIKSTQFDTWYFPHKTEVFASIMFPIFPWNTLEEARQAQKDIAKHRRISVDRLSVDSIEDHYFRWFDPQ